MPLKKEIRSTFLARRQALSQAQMHYLIAGMLEHFQALNFPAPLYLLSYLPMEIRNEVIPRYFEEVVLDDNPSCQICYPRSDFASSTITVIADEPDLRVAPNRFGVPEPENGRVVQPVLLDIILVPMVAFDLKGIRVGYGKGFYDRFIPACRENIITIGLSFFEPVEEITDAGIFDVPLKYCITPQQVYEF